jgi:predicted DNA-binding transcriptional regulator AlpA
MQPISTYLDIDDLAALLGLTPGTIRRRLRTRPWTLPPSAHLGPDYPIRWRQADAARWLQEQEQ